MDNQDEAPKRPRLDSTPRVIEVWQKQSPQQQMIDALKQAPPLDLNGNKYQDVGKIHHGDVDAAIERTIAKQEAARGVSIDQPDVPKATVNTNGIKDERPKEYWTPPRIGKR